jgi:hypothetical protein
VENCGNVLVGKASGRFTREPGNLGDVAKSSVVGGVLYACSGCGGDYEDPDRTAWDYEEEEQEAHDPKQEAPDNEFPAD